jgi:hypothetical protein
MLLITPVAVGIVVASFLATSYVLNRYAQQPDFVEDQSTKPLSLRDVTTTGSLLPQIRGRNLIWPSEDFTNARWTRYQIGAIQAAAAAAPNGTNSATRLTASNEKGRHFIYSNVGGTQPGAVHAFSVYFEPQEGTSVGFEFRDSPQGRYGNALCDAPKSDASGAITKAGDVIDGAVDNAGNGWFRCWVAMPFSLANAVVVIQLRDPKGSTNYQGDSRSGVLIWGAQLEQGNRPTNYVANTGPVAKVN